jgi:DNA-binding NarL/FixJ family response regulator
MKTILIVDDEELFTQALAEGLMAHDPSIQILVANDGLAATHLLASHDVNLLLTDLDMPQMDGVELAAYVSRCHPHVPVAVITAFASRQVSERLRPFKIVGLIDKPADLADLYGRIRKVLDLDSEPPGLRGAPARRRPDGREDAGPGHGNGCEPA